MLESGDWRGSRSGQERSLAQIGVCDQPPSKVALYSFGMQNLLRKRPDADPMLGLNLIERAATAGYVTAILELVKLLENGTADIVPDLRRAYRLLAGAITDHSDMKLHEAYLSFVERNQPLSTLLDS